MKRITLFCASVILCLCLSLTALAGQTKPGGAYCEPVDNVTCFDDGPGMNGLAATGEQTPGASPLGDVTGGLFVLALALFMVSRFKA
ncbi:MAG TPA: hypothetical protein VNI02_17465 [Blastocatellia bacterium]|nr:hypothetical protein [Blastocatellia bacterium]